jgi:hypothetical protein
VHPDPIVVVAEREKVRAEGIKKIEAALVVIRDAVGFFLGRSATAQRREIPQVAKVDAMVRLPIVGEGEKLFLRCLAYQSAVVVGCDYELF